MIRFHFSATSRSARCTCRTIGRGVAGMKRSLSMAQQVVASFVITISILVAIGAYSASRIEHLVGTSRSVSQTHEELTELSSFLAALDEAETGTRGFVITGRDAMLAPYNQGKGALGRHHARLQVLFRDEAQARRVADLRPLLDERMREIEATIDARRRGGFDAALTLVQDSRHEEVMGRIRAIVSELRAHQQDVLAQRKAAVASEGSRVVRDLGLLALGALAQMILGAVLVVGGAMRRIAKAARGIDGASNELDAAARQQLEGAKELVASATAVSSTVREMVATSRQIAASAGRVTELARGTSTAAKGGTQMTDGAQQTMAIVRQRSERLTASVLDLSKRSEEIGGILDIVGELAEQTNILAVNATIEAAGVGEPGRRFGVVAGEIRKLADRVSNSTKDIRLRVDDIRKAESTMILASDDFARLAEGSARRYAKLAQSFQQIAALADDTVQAALEIEHGTQQQASAVEQVSSAITSVAQTAHEGESSAAQTGATASQLATLSRQLGQIVGSAPAPA
ncbi:CHASE3 domain-containing protein [Polyangium aurulentum]|uniref:CHASE3 domain-containing protein n=1 Tax=Polyangium aurulentum TaxID=2567896 RepID=UPI00200F704D|nr:CHASE3 domain-containing protein [Polyangium aurulentum]UQA62008.1 CHASE3 domain-containing protein [Polyangium aurulentum]